MPVAVALNGVLAGKAVVSVSSGGAHSCAVTTDGGVYCWGDNSDGQLGNGNTVDSAVPVAVVSGGAMGGNAAKSVSAGAFHSCAVTTSGRAFCWGSNGSGELGDGDTLSSTDPVAVDTTGALQGKTVVSISAGGGHSCAATSDGGAYCWGGNVAGALGNSSLADSFVPVAVDSSGVLKGKIVTAVSAGERHSCAVTNDGGAYCWGDNSSGRLGNGSTNNSPEPVSAGSAGALQGKTVASVSAGSHSCAVTTVGAPFCWGDNASGQLGSGVVRDTSVPGAVDSNGVLKDKKVAAVSAGGSHSCAVTTDGGVYCWGLNSRGELGSGDFTNSAVPVAVAANGVLKGKLVASVSAGERHSCAVTTDGRVHCWGSNRDGQLGNGNKTDSAVPVSVNTAGVLGGKTVVAVSTGGRHSCAVTTDGGVYCWGANTLGQLGNGTTNDSAVPVAVNNSGVLKGKAVRSVSGGDAHSCAVTSDGGAYCWGGNADGQLGNGSTNNSAVPVVVSTGGVLGSNAVSSVSAGAFHSCAVTTSGRAVCWGSNSRGALGNGGTSNSDVPVAVATGGVLQGKTVTDVSAGGGHSCAVTSDGGGYCWGFNADRQLGDGKSDVLSVAPAVVVATSATTGKGFAHVDAGGNHTLAIAADTTTPPPPPIPGPIAWGWNGDGQLGNGTDEPEGVPVAVDTSGALAGKTVVDVSAGGSHSCAVTSDGGVYCWGYNGEGQLGNGGTVDSAVPVAVDTGALAGRTATSVSAGYGHTCVVTSDGGVYCWGYNGEGQVGNGSTLDTPVPVAVDTDGLAGQKAITVSAGVGHTCAVTTDGGAYCWGENSDGALGNGSTDNSPLPVAVASGGVLQGKTVTAISAGYGYSCAITVDGGAYCWGENSAGQLGNGTTDNSFVPVAVDNRGVLQGKRVTAMSTGFAQTCVVTDTGGAFCWGENGAGGLGDGSTDNSSLPVAVDTRGVLNAKMVTAVSTGNGFSCVVTDDGGAFCWGENIGGGLGDGSTDNSLVPVAVSLPGGVRSIDLGLSHALAI